MARKVFFSVTMLLDGHRARVPRGLDGAASGWNCSSGSFLKRLLPREPEARQGRRGRARDNDIVRETFERTGESVMGKRMFDAGEQGVAGGGAVPQGRCSSGARPTRSVTPGSGRVGPTFHFVNDGIETALDQAARPPATGTSASRAAARRSWSNVRERRPDRRVHHRAFTHICSARNPPVRGRGRGPRGPGAASARSRRSG